MISSTSAMEKTCVTAVLEQNQLIKAYNSLTLHEYLRVINHDLHIIVVSYIYKVVAQDDFPIIVKQRNMKRIDVKNLKIRLFSSGLLIRKSRVNLTNCS